MADNYNNSEHGTALLLIILARLFLPRLSARDLDSLFADQRWIILTLRQFEPNLEGQPLKKRVAQSFLPELLFWDGVRIFKATFPKLRDFLNRNGATIPHHFAHRLDCQLARGLCEKLEEKEDADRLAPQIINGRLSTPQKAVV